MQIKKGATRIVIILKKYVIKIPRFKTMRSFSNGLSANLYEKEFSEFLFPYVSPTIFSLWGFLNIQYKVLVTNQDAELKIWIKNLDSIKCESQRKYLINSVELKTDSIGYLNNKIVACDYG